MAPIDSSSSYHCSFLHFKLTMCVSTKMTNCKYELLCKCVTLILINMNYSFFIYYFQMAQMLPNDILPFLNISDEEFAIIYDDEHVDIEWDVIENYKKGLNFKTF